MKRMIMLSMVVVAVFAVYALAQPAADTPASPAATARTQPQNTPMQCGPGGCMMAGKSGMMGSQSGMMCCQAGKCPRCKGMMACQAGKCPRCKGMMACQTGKCPRCKGMVGKAGMDPAMMKRMQVMMQTPIFMDSPCALYGRATDLKLSDAQQAQLMKIENDARRRALEVLTPEQRKKMGDIPAQPMALMQMCRPMCTRMMPMMQQKMGSQGKPMTSCPMMKPTGSSDKSMMNCPMMNSTNPPAGKPAQPASK